MDSGRLHCSRTCNRIRFIPVLEMGGLRAPCLSFFADRAGTFWRTAVVRLSNRGFLHHVP